MLAGAEGGRWCSLGRGRWREIVLRHDAKKWDLVVSGGMPRHDFWREKAKIKREPNRAASHTQSTMNMLGSGERVENDDPRGERRGKCPGEEERRENWGGHSARRYKGGGNEPSLCPEKAA